MKVALPILAILCLVNQAYSEQDESTFTVSRKWTQKATGKSFEGKFVKLDNGDKSVVVEKLGADGVGYNTLHTLNLESLSAEDNEFIKSYLVWREEYNKPENVRVREAKEELKSLCNNIKATVVQVLDDGLLVNKLNVDGSDYLQSQIIKIKMGNTEGYIDNGRYEFKKCITIGTFKYTSVVGATNTVKHVQLVDDDFEKAYIENFKKKAE